MNTADMALAITIAALLASAWHLDEAHTTALPAHSAEALNAQPAHAHAPR